MKVLFTLVKLLDPLVNGAAQSDDLPFWGSCRPMAVHVEVVAWGSGATFCTNVTVLMLSATGHMLSVKHGILDQNAGCKEHLQL